MKGNGLLAIGMATLWLGYGFASWGYCLMKGYDISIRAWFSPLHPYQWPPPGGTVPRIPQGKLWPGKGSGEPTTQNPVTSGTP